MQLPYYSVITLLSFHPEKGKHMFSYQNTKIYMKIFIVALCVTIKNWKQSRCPSTGRWLNDKYYKYNKKEWITGNTQQPAWISSELCWVKKKANYKMLHRAWFHLYVLL